MKIVIYAIITVQPERRQGLLDLLQDWLPRVHKQQGCLRYDWSADGFIDNQILVYEEWEDKSALDNHFAGENFASIGKVIGEYGVLGASARKFAIGKEGPVFNTDGAATSDF